MTKRPLLLFPWACVAFLCQTGCLANRYAEAYVPTPSVLADRFTEAPSGPVVIRPVTTEEEVLEAIETGYVPLGNSTFSGIHCPWVCAIDFAETIGADLVLIDERYKGTETRTSVLYLPSYQHSYSYGTTHFSSYGASPMASTYGTCSGHTTTTSYNAIPIWKAVEVYEQSAMFLRKGAFEGFYGAILRQPPRLPDEMASAEVPVQVFAVLKGSQAQKDGITRGQRVVSINGQCIRTRADFAPFAEDPRRIQTMAVAP